MNVSIDMKQIWIWVKKAMNTDKELEPNWKDMDMDLHGYGYEYRIY